MKDKFRQWILHNSAFLETFQGMITCITFLFIVILLTLIIDAIGGGLLI